MAAMLFPARLQGAKIALFIDYSFEDLVIARARARAAAAPSAHSPVARVHHATRREQEVTYPQKRLEEEGATVVVIGSHPAGTRYTGKFGYPVVRARARDWGARDWGRGRALCAMRLLIPARFVRCLVHRALARLLIPARLVRRPGCVYV